MTEPTPDLPVRKDPLGWWTISGRDLLDMLRQAHAGANPDMVYAEAYANSDHEQADGA